MEYDGIIRDRVGRYMTGQVEEGDKQVTRVIGLYRLVQTNVQLPPPVQSPHRLRVRP